jgi:NADH-quinone oxidoreductase subunit M
VGIAVVAAAALNGIAVVRAYFLPFTGARHVSMVSLGIRRRERIAVLTFSAIILGGGFFPQEGVITRHRAALEVLAERKGEPALLEQTSNGFGPASVASLAPGSPQSKARDLFWQLNFAGIRSRRDE